MSRVSVVVFCPDGNPNVADSQALAMSLHLNSIIANWDGRTAIPFCGALVLTRSREAFDSDLAGLYRRTWEDAFARMVA